MTKRLTVVLGPTASGKTSLAIQLAQQLNTEIISADSRQFFREMTIGTAKPTPSELAAAPHHFINSHSISDDYSAGQFEKDALQKIAKLHSKHDDVILVGGSGLYIKAVCEGLDQFPDVDPSIRQRLKKDLEAHGLNALQNQLKSLDAEHFQHMDRSNPQRVIRALEVTIGTGQPYSSFLAKGAAKRPFEIEKIGIDWDRDTLYHRINQRVDLMVAAGLVDEVQALFPQKHLNALQTVGYQEIFDFLEGKHDLDRAIELIKQNSRRFAKRQLTWFRRDPSIKWVQPNEIEDFFERRFG